MTMEKFRRQWLALVILGGLASVALVGCGGVKRVPVVGTVTRDGKPLDGVRVIFSPDAAKGNTSQISCDSWVKEGRYELQTTAASRAGTGAGAPLGWYKVTVIAPQTGGRKMPSAPVEINDKYKNIEKTPLAIEVKDNPEPGAYDIKLEK
jgi:hypothetical protein